MLMNKRLDRLKQWAGERMGGEIRTTVTEDFKTLELEMTLRHEGMDKMHRSMTGYMKSLSRRHDGDEKDKALPLSYLGSTMVAHGEDFESDSQFGRCLTGFGRANERIARLQETYAVQATATWLESMERSLAQMKEYQAARKKLDTRRLAYDTSLGKMEKAKREDFRVEEELRSQKAKYEESNEDVFRRMEDIRVSEVENVTDLTAFLEAELAYHDKCKEVLLQLQRDWPATASSSADDRTFRRGNRSRANTVHSMSDRGGLSDDEPSALPSRNPTNQFSIPTSPQRDSQPSIQSRSALARNNSFESSARAYREDLPTSRPKIGRPATDTNLSQPGRIQVRTPTKVGGRGDKTYDGYDSPDRSSSPDQPFTERSTSPATSYGSGPSRMIALVSSDAANASQLRKGPAPPPPPSRSKKPPPPPPAKRSALSASEVARS